MGFFLLPSPPHWDIFLSIVAIATSNTGPKQREELFARTAAGDTYLGWGGRDGSVTAVMSIAQMGKLRQKQVTLGEAGEGVNATGTTEMGVGVLGISEGHRGWKVYSGS